MNISLPISRTENTVINNRKAFSADRQRYAQLRVASKRANKEVVTILLLVVTFEREGVQCQCSAVLYFCCRRVVFVDWSRRYLVLGTGSGL
jgi:hypothetical protein